MEVNITNLIDAFKNHITFKNFQLIDILRLFLFLLAFCCCSIPKWIKHSIQDVLNIFISNLLKPFIFLQLSTNECIILLIKRKMINRFQKFSTLSSKHSRSLPLNRVRNQFIFQVFDEIRDDARLLIFDGFKSLLEPDLSLNCVQM